MINWGLIANPANWLIVFLMLAIAAMGATMINKGVFGDAG